MRTSKKVTFDILHILALMNVTPNTGGLSFVVEHADEEIEEQDNHAEVNRYHIMRQVCATYSTHSQSHYCGRACRDFAIL